ncbi:hypothetical protein [Bradyrhizobium japonicum]|uniref:hypothetical protein n=1 Tax=Bradyrhizobium japonicum TaxID=375 RepID=UPI0004200E12|nr:hypothetical protein [Bradyrhizobium japonicum]
MSKAASENKRKQQGATSALPKCAPAGLPDLIIDQADLPAAAVRLADQLSAADVFFRRAEALVKVVESDRGPVARPITVHDVVNHGHRVCRPVFQKIVQGEIVLEPVTLPDRVARLYLNLHDKWAVGELNGICRAPILSNDGNIRIAQGYDPQTGYWCAGIDAPDIPKRPSRQQAEKALRVLRSAFATFPFADAPMVTRSGSTTIVDLSKPPGPVGRSKSPGYGHLKLPHLMIAGSAAEQR